MCASHVPSRELCLAFGKTCFKCSRKNLFAVKCKSSRKKNVRTVDSHLYGSDSSNSSSEYEHVDNVTIREKVNAVREDTIKAKMIVEGKPTDLQLDSGTSVNILKPHHVIGKNLEPSNKTLVAEMKPLGECRVKMLNPKTRQKYAVMFVVVREDFHPLLGAGSIQKMALMTVNNDKFRMVARVSQRDKFSCQHPDEMNSRMYLKMNWVNYSMTYI